MTSEGGSAGGDETAIIFDVGNVLLRWDPRLLLDRLLPAPGAVDAFMAEIGFDAWNLAQDAGRSWAEGVQAASAAHPAHAATLAAFAARWAETLPGPVPGSLEILRALADAGRPLYAITNFSAEKWAETADRFPFLKNNFCDVVVSAHEGVVKPDPRIFRICLDRNGLAAARCVFIDDSPVNVAGAAAVGLDAIRFEHAEGLAAALRDRGLLG